MKASNAAMLVDALESGLVMQRAANFETDLGLLTELRQLFRSPERTKEWVENNYYHVRAAQQTAGLIPMTAFWADYAAHPADTPFLSPHVAETTSSFAEMLMALAVLDLPIDPKAPERQREESALRIKPVTPLLVFHEEVQPASAPDARLPLIVRQDIFDPADRYRFEGNERMDKFVTAEFLAGHVYTAQIVLTNPTSSRRRTNVLLQIPQGAIPVNRGFYSRSRHVQVEPYSTQTLHYNFYFPLPGEFPHAPAQVAQEGVLAGRAEPFDFHVVNILTQIDKDAWPYISQYGTEEQVIDFLKTHNLGRIKLEKIAFRMKEAATFKRVTSLLDARHTYQHTLWSYGIKHDQPASIQQYLRHDGFAKRCGRWVESPLLTVDPVERATLEHREYWPLINARTYQLGKRRQIVNDALYTQYTAHLTALSYRSALNADERIATAVYLLIQDRVDDALRLVQGLTDDELETDMQLDYLSAYLAFSESRPDDARAIAKRYTKHPVERWRQRFADILAQAEEISGSAARIQDPDSREQVQGQLAATEPSLELKIDQDALVLTTRNLETASVNYYPMDLEQLFSRNPFVQDVSSRFSVIRPAETQAVKLSTKRPATPVEIPRELRSRNVIVEVTAGGLMRQAAYTPHAMDVQVIETYGQVTVRHAKTGRPVSAAYVKVYGRKRGGDAVFYKDGYTDLRGRFDYASISTDDLDGVERFAILVLSDEHGAIVREAAPPQR